MPGPAGASRFDRRILIGILFMCGAGSLFPVMNGLVKELGAAYDSTQIVWARVLGHLIFVLILFAPSRGFAILKSVKLPWQIGRSLLLLASTMMFFHAVKDIPLAKAASISFTAPLIVTLLALPILGEHIGVSRLLAAMVGFAGVLIVIRPGSELFQWASLLIVGSALCYALYQIFTRKVAGFDAPETSVVYSALIGTLITTAIVPFIWTTPVNWLDAVIMASLGVFGGARPLLRRAFDDLRAGQHRGAVPILPDDRLGGRGLPHAEPPAGRLHVAGRGHHHRQRPLHRLDRDALKVSFLPNDSWRGAPKGRMGSRRGLSNKDHVSVTKTTSAPHPAFGHLPHATRGEGKTRQTPNAARSGRALWKPVASWNALPSFSTVASA